MNPRISIDPQVQHGRPVIKGTRIPVVRILGCIAERMTIEETAAEYRVSVDDVLAALDFASELVEQAQQRGSYDSSTDLERRALSPSRTAG